MPEGNTRVAIRGLRKIEKAFDRVVRQRLEAERASVDVERELRDMAREARELEREASRG